MPKVDEQCKGPGATHYFACQCREESFAKIRTTLDQIVAQDRLRGYPTGPEWIVLIKAARAALEGK